MHIDLNLISIFFRGSIFCLFVYKMYQIFIKEKLKAFLEAGLQASRNEQVEFVEKDALLSSTKKRLEGQLNQQKLGFVSLEKKYAQFVDFQLQEREAESAEIALRIQSITAKRIIQQRNLSYTLAMQGAVPKALEQARNSLAPHYQGGQGKLVLNDYLKTLA